LAVLPENGTPEEEILAKIRECSQYSKKFYLDDGNITGAVYIKDPKHWEFIAEVQKYMLKHKVT
jgi:hypothetical protein